MQKEIDWEELTIVVPDFTMRTEICPCYALCVTSKSRSNRLIKGV